MIITEGGGTKGSGCVGRKRVLCALICFSAQGGGEVCKGMLDVESSLLIQPGGLSTPSPLH